MKRFFILVSIFFYSSILSASIKIECKKNFMPEENPFINIITSTPQQISFRLYKIKKPLSFFKKNNNIIDLLNIPEIEKPDLIKNIYYKFKNYINVSHLINKKSNMILIPEQFKMVDHWTARVEGNRQINIPKLDEGGYIIEAKNKNTVKRQLLFSTKIGAIIKRSINSVLLTPVFLKTGKIDTKVKLYFLSNKKPKGKQIRYPFIFKTTSNDPIKILLHHLESYCYLDIPKINIKDYIKTWLITDKIFYKKSDTIKYFAIFGKLNGGAYNYKSIKNIKVHLVKNNNIIYENLHPSNMNIINGEIQTINLNPGEYKLILKIDNYKTEKAIFITENRKTPYNLSIKCTETIISGNDINIFIKSATESGTPLKKGFLNLKILQRTKNNIKIIKDSQVVLRNGKYNFKLSTKKLNTCIITIIAELSENDNITQISHRTINVIDQRESIKIETGKNFYIIGEIASFIIKSSKYIKPHPIKLKITDALKNTVFNKELMSNIYGSTQYDIMLKNPGYYETEILLNSPSGKQLKSRSSFWIVERSGFQENNEDYIQIIPDKKEYKASDISKILIISKRKSVNALVTLEGDNLFWYKHHSFTDNAEVIDIPINEKYTPKIVLSVHTIKNNIFNTKYEILNIPANKKIVNFNFEENKFKYYPGDNINFNLQTINFWNREINSTVLLFTKDIEYDIGNPYYEFYDILKSPNVMTYIYPKHFSHEIINNKTPHFFDISKYIIKKTYHKIHYNNEPKNLYWKTYQIQKQSVNNVIINTKHEEKCNLFILATTPDMKINILKKPINLKKDVSVKLSKIKFLRKEDILNLKVTTENNKRFEKKINLQLITKNANYKGQSSLTAIIKPYSYNLSYWNVHPKTSGDFTLNFKAVTDEMIDNSTINFPIFNNVDTINFKRHYIKTKKQYFKINLKKGETSSLSYIGNKISKGSTILTRIIIKSKKSLPHLSIIEEYPSCFYPDKNYDLYNIPKTHISSYETNENKMIFTINNPDNYIVINYITRVYLNGIFSIPPTIISNIDTESILTTIIKNKKIIVQ